MPLLASPDGNTSFDIEIRQLSGALEPGQLSATFIVNGQPINVLPQAAGRGNLYTFQIPQSTCGDRIQYSITAQATDGTTVQSPFNAPAQLHEVVSGFDAAVLMIDDFEQDLGWVSEPLDATGGWWERGVPVSDFLWIYGPPADSDGSGQCWLTGNHLGNSDVDDGSVRLSSPTYQVSADTSIVEYDYYLRLSNENGNDRLVVQATDGLNPWVEIARHDNDGGVAWHNHRVTPQDLVAAGVTNTGTLQIRFTVSDLTPQSIVEAGVDNLRISQLDCQADVIGDLNDDQRVDIFDLLIMVDAWGPCLFSCPPSCLADIEPNCAVDVFDLLLLLDQWSDDVTPAP